MDVGELLSFKPDTPGVAHGTKRSAEDEGDHGGGKRRIGGLAGNPDSDGTELLDEVPEGEALDEMGLKRMILQFEKRVLKNQEMRIKFPDIPAKFMESELELNDILQEMHVVATVPDLYHILVDMNAIQSLLQLLNHENSDVSIAVVDLLQEMTDVDTLTDSEEGASTLIDALMDGQLVALLIQNLDRLDESVKEESDGVHYTLGIIENVTELRPDLCIEITQQGLLQWLLKRLRAKLPFEGNKLYCSEIMAILLQNHEDIRKMLGEIDGIDILLQQLASYKRHDPQNTEEIEFMENLFNCMCSALMLADNRERFLKGEGLQLMNLMLREKKMSRYSAIKVLNYAMSGAEGSDNCQKFVDILGLRSIFPIFMKTPKQHRKLGVASDELEEHIVAIIAAMLRNCQGTQRQRLLNKFTENDHEKVDRLMELHFKYLDKIRAVDEKIEREKQKIREIDEETEDQFYLRRLEAGLFTLQLTDMVILEACVSGPPSVKQRVMKILNLRGGSVRTVRSIMREYAGNIGDAIDPDAREAEQDRILQLVDKF